MSMELILPQKGSQNVVTQGMKKAFHQCLSVWGEDKIRQEFPSVGDRPKDTFWAGNLQDGLHATDDLHKGLAGPSEPVCRQPPSFLPGMQPGSAAPARRDRLCRCTRGGRRSVGNETAASWRAPLSSLC